MPLEITAPPPTRHVRVARSCGQDIALSVRDIVGILPAGADAPARRARFGAVDMVEIEARARPLVSLRDALRLEPAPGTAAAPESQVVVLRAGTALFGLAVEQLGEPEAVRVLPKYRPTHCYDVFGDLVMDRAGEVVPALNPIWAALTVDSGLLPAQPAASRTAAELAA